VTVLVDVTGVFTITVEIGDSWIKEKVGLVSGRDRIADPQEGSRTITTHATNNLLNTLAVYHKIS
jgi:hypothetical protein